MTEKRMTRTERMRQGNKIAKKPDKATKASKKKQGKKRKGGFSWRIFLAILLFLAAAVLFLLDPIKNYLVRQGQEANAVTELDRNKRAEIEANEKKEVNYDFGVIKPLNPYDVIANGINAKDLPTVGGVAMPDVGMNLPIYKGEAATGSKIVCGKEKIIVLHHFSPYQRVGITISLKKIEWNALSIKRLNKNLPS